MDMKSPALLLLVPLAACEFATHVGELPDPTAANTSMDTAQIDVDVDTDEGPGPDEGDPTEGSSDASCILDGVVTDDCPPPPEDWCASDRSTPVPEGLRDYWNSFCADLPGPSGGDVTGSDDEDPPSCDFADPCPPPPIDWCTDGSGVDSPLPEEVVAYWDSFCTGTDTDTDD